jgi:hypothetical protein
MKREPRGINITVIFLKQECHGQVKYHAGYDPTIKVSRISGDCPFKKQKSGFYL